MTNVAEAPLPAVHSWPLLNEQTVPPFPSPSSPMAEWCMKELLLWSKIKPQDDNVAIDDQESVRAKHSIKPSNRNRDVVVGNNDEEEEVAADFL